MAPCCRLPPPEPLKGPSHRSMNMATIALSLCHIGTKFLRACRRELLPHGTSALYNGNIGAQHSRNNVNAVDAELARGIVASYFRVNGRILILRHAIACQCVIVMP